MNEDAVLAWILNQQTEETIENVNLEILDKILEDEEYVAVFFCMRKLLQYLSFGSYLSWNLGAKCFRCEVYIADTDSAKCKNCDTVLAELEKIDDESNDAGIHFVKTNDKDVAKWDREFTIQLQNCKSYNNGVFAFKFVGSTEWKGIQNWFTFATKSHWFTPATFWTKRNY